MMGQKQRWWAIGLTRLATRHPWPTLGTAGVVTVAAVVLAAQLELRMNWTDLLPDGHPTVRTYRELVDRFGEPSLVIALEGERDAIVAMAEELEPRLHELESLRTAVGRLPSEFFRDHGFALLRPDQFDRALDTYADWTLTGTLRGLNDDYEREYTSSEANLRRDEVDVARGLLGMTRALELLRDIAAGEAPAATVVEAADALLIGEPWVLSLDRRMLLIACTPWASTDQLDESMAMVEEVEAVMYEVAANHPEVYASTTGMAKIGKDEMESVGTYTVFLSLIALGLIYLLLARTLNGWGIPLLALLPLVLGVLWTQGVLYVFFGGLNIMTAMMMLVLLGLGVDFSIHLIARFQEEMGRETGLETALIETFSGTGTAVIVGALTTALAFLTLMVGETRGIHEFGVAAGVGVLLTLLAIYVTLPVLLTLRHRRRIRRGKDFGARTSLGGHGYRWIGTVAAAGWRHPGLFLGGAVLISAGCVWAALQNEFEWDFLELEAKGLRSVELQREIPTRFGTSDHGAWLVTASVDESRALKERYRHVPTVGEVSAVSDFIPPEDRLAEYRPRLEAFREGLRRPRTAWSEGDAPVLAAELDRLWDNLDLVSNLAYAAGLDRITGVIDGMTGVDSETGETDSTAILPTLARALADGSDSEVLAAAAGVWADRTRENLMRMTNPAPVTMEAIPSNFLRTFTAREGEGFLLHIVARDYLWDRESLVRFAEQTEAIDPDVIGTERLIIVMNDETLADGRKAALLALAVIGALLFLHFRGPVGLLALLPLVVGSLGMLGLMFLFRMEYNFMNLIATPIILGIGIDDGVHALHRFRAQAGDGATRAAESFGFVGKAILLTSLTTMIGFGSVALYAMRGMASFGQVLFMGVGLCFLATVLVLPAVLRVATRGR
jgi:predicted RND superfamily exporter protein